MRLIDADAYKKYLDDNWIVANHDAIDAQPTIDAVEVVRCKDCKWWEGCRMLDDDDGYCSDGERKNDD